MATASLTVARTVIGPASLEHRRLVRQVRALLLTGTGWPTAVAAELLDVSQQTVITDISVELPTSIPDDLLAEALDGLPAECAAAADDLYHRVRGARAGQCGPDLALVVRVRTFLAERVDITCYDTRSLLRVVEEAGDLLRAVLADLEPQR